MPLLRGYGGRRREIAIFTDPPHSGPKTFWFGHWSRVKRATSGRGRYYAAQRSPYRQIYMTPALGYATGPARDPVREAAADGGVVGGKDGRRP